MHTSCVQFPWKLGMQLPWGKADLAVFIIRINIFNYQYVTVVAMV